MCRMPRASRDVKLLVETSNNPVTDHLRNEWFRMKQALKEDLGECPVCMEAFNCRKCTLLLSCGHCVCATCFLKLRSACCPICRQ